jgi:hypothetical protein
MNRFGIFKTKEKKMLDLSTDLFDIRNSTEKLFPSNIELKNKIGKDIFDIDLTIEDIYKDNDSYPINTIQNPIDFNIFENYNISSMNTTNDFKFLECFDNIQPLLKDIDNKSKKKKIFNIAKINKRMGRLKKDSFMKGKHDKFSEDNLIRKIKRRFLENLRIYINEEYKKYCLEKKKTKGKKNWLKKIDPNFSRSIKRKDNLQWFNLKTFELFSENLSSKYTTFDTSSNKKKIKNFFKSKESSKLKNILNTTIDTFFNKYITNEKFDNFKTLNDDKMQLEKQMKQLGQENIKEYLERYESIAINLKTIFIKKAGRKKNHY